MQLSDIQRKPSARTGGGVFGFTDAGVYVPTYQVEERDFKNDKVKEAYENDSAVDVRNMAVIAQNAFRGYILRIIAIAMFMAAALSVAAFFATEKKEERWPCALGATINFVAAWHYHKMAELRAQPGLHTDRVPRYLDRHQAFEFYADALRFCDWTVRRNPFLRSRSNTAVLCNRPRLLRLPSQVTLPMLVLKLYAIIGRTHNGDAAGAPYNGIHLGPESAAWLAALMIMLGAIVRLGTDDFADWRHQNGFFTGPIGGSASWWLNVFGVVALLGSLAAFVLLEFELFRASEGIEENRLLNSFFLVWSGYPLVFIISIVLRRNDSKNEDSGGKFDPALSVFKDVSYGLLDTWSKVVFAMWSVHTVFEISPYYGAPAASPHKW